MSDHLIPTRDALVSDFSWPQPGAAPTPSQELLDRARFGWERFLDSMEKTPDE
ncbi:hypothetical protein AB0F18_04415 [Streptomyces sp. NPDC029216]|uniref:hypothetical protein n=1 Tax=Streptomyces sp. NPDC029216 TaxID=3154701 RepID=UPI0033F77693